MSIWWCVLEAVAVIVWVVAFIAIVVLLARMDAGDDGDLDD